ncbi:hypothetical protein Scep_000069 [Stephania cephalantha]|uniref:Uncharacterized protein n=1 Tax=Stephania cephalantha TaxID=152367 RepID=A0AAP0L5F6_9MAGN
MELSHISAMMREEMLQKQSGRVACACFPFFPAAALIPKLYPSSHCIAVSRCFSESQLVFRLPRIRTLKHPTCKLTTLKHSSSSSALLSKDPARVACISRIRGPPTPS